MGEGQAPPDQNQPTRNRRPVVPIALALVAGVGASAQLPAGIWILLAIVAVAGAWIVRGRAWAGACLLLAIVCAGGALARTEGERFADNEISLFSTDEPKWGFFELQLSDEPSIAAGQFGQLRELPPKQRVEAEARAVKTWAGWAPASGHVLLQIDGVLPSLTAGQRVRVFGQLQRPSAAANPGQLDWAALYRQQRVLATVTVPHAENVQLLGAPTPSLWVRLHTEATRLLAAGFLQRQALHAALLSAMLLGDRDATLRQEWPLLQQAGLSYQLSVSGLHVAVIGAGVWLVCRMIRMRPRAALIAATAGALLYVLVAAPSFSGVRAGLGAALIAAAVLLRRSVDRLQLLAMIGVVIVLWQPLDVFSVGLQLSVAVVLAIVLLLPRWEAFWAERQDLHAKVAAGLRRPTRGQQFRAALLRRVAQTFAIGLLAWLAVLPIVAYQFGELNPWTPLLGTLTLPLVLLGMAAGSLKIVLTLLWPLGAGWWAAAAAVPAGWLQRLALCAASLPAGRVLVAAPPVAVIPVYYGLLLLPLVPTHWVWGSRRWMLRAGPVVGVLAVLLLPLLPTPAGRANGLRVTLLSLGAGQCAVVQPPDAPPVLIDAGSSTVNDLVRTIISPFFRAVGITHVEQIFLSHGDYDHVSAADPIAAAYGVRHVSVSPLFRPNAAGSYFDQQLLNELDGLNLTPGLIARGDRLDLGHGAAIRVLWPPGDGALNSNNSGLVLRLTYAGKSILFPADIQDPAFAGLLRHPAELASDVLVAAHHGSSESLTPAFLRAVSPRFIVSSNASRLTEKQKVFDAMVGKTPLYRTSAYGAITVSISPTGEISVSTFLKPQR